MATHRELYEARMLATRYGPIGKVAGSYRTAGYEVEVIGVEEGLPVNFIATKTGERLAVKVYLKSGQVPLSVIEELKREASNSNCRPVLVLYGRGPRLTKEIIEKAKEMEVAIRRVRA